MNEESIIESVKDLWRAVRMYEKKSNRFHKRAEELQQRWPHTDRTELLVDAVFEEVNKKYSKT